MELDYMKGPLLQAGKTEQTSLSVVNVKRVGVVEMNQSRGHEVVVHLSPSHLVGVC